MAFYKRININYSESSNNVGVYAQGIQGEELKQDSEKKGEKKGE